MGKKKYMRSDRAFVLDPEYDPELAKDDSQQFGPAAKANVSYAESVVTKSQRKLFALAELFDHTHTAELQIDVERIAGMSELLEEIAEDLSRVQSALNECLTFGQHLERDRKTLDDLIKQKRTLVGLTDEDDE